MCIASILLVAAAVHLQSPQSPDPAVTTGFTTHELTIGDVVHRYVVYVPPGYGRVPKEYASVWRWPLVMFLHGMGECGTDGKQVDVGLGPAIRNDPVRWPFVVVFPQKPTKESQWIDHEALVMGTLAATEERYRVEPSQRFLTGLSQGGGGTWALGAKHADVWAAVAPVCGYGKPSEIATALRAMPIWAFHGEDDKTVPAQQSKDLCAAVDAAGGNATLTLYPKVGHNSWDNAYRDSALAEWFRVGPGGPGHGLTHPESKMGLSVFLRTNREGVRVHETLTLINGWMNSEEGWQVRRAFDGGNATEDAVRVVTISKAEGANLLSVCLRTLIRGGLYELPTNESFGELDESGAESIGFDDVVGPGGRSVSYLPRHVRVDDKDHTIERDALREVAARLRAVK